MKVKASCRKIYEITIGERVFSGLVHQSSWEGLSKLTDGRESVIVRMAGITDALLDFTSLELDIVAGSPAVMEALAAVTAETETSGGAS